jgi:glycosyltransferase involved in cell wall biosynthesis
VHLVLVGSEDGVTFDECRSAAAHDGLHNRVHVVGPAYGDHKRGFLDASDVYLSLSHRENFNYTAAEAMAAGLPVILSAGNDLAAEVADAGCGWMLSESCDPAAAIAEAAAIDDASRVEMGHRARAWATEHLRFEDFATRVRRFVDEIAPAR